MNTPNVDLPLLAQNSLQLSPAYNDSMQKLDALVQLVPLSKAVTAPPTTTEADVGKSWIVPTGASGDWAAHSTEIALCSSPGLWIYFQPRTGWYAHVRDENLLYRYNDTFWEEAGAGSGAGIPDAPADGKLYGRQSGAWVEVVGGGGGGTAEEVTYDNTASGLTAADVQAAIDELAASSAVGIPEAPVDGLGYVRKDESWVPESGGGGGGTTYVQRLLAMVPEALYRLDEVSGTSAADSSGNGHTGTYTGGVTLGVASITPGSADKCAQFDGVDDYVAIPATGGLLLTAGQEFTVCLTIRYDSSSSPASGCSLSKATDTNRAVQIDMAGGNLFLRSGDGVVNPSTSNTLAKIFGGKTMTVALVRRIEAATSYLEAWVNGTLVDRVTTTDNPGTGIDWAIGARYSTIPALVNFFKGKIQNVAIFTRALSFAEAAMASNANDLG